MKRWLLAFGLALTLGQAAQPATPPETVPVTISQYRNGLPFNEPAVGIATDGTGRAMIVIGMGHGVMPFITAGGRTHMLLYQGDRTDIGLVSEAVPAMARTLLGRGIVEAARRLSRQRLEVVPAGAETVEGFAGRAFDLTLIEDGHRGATLRIVISADPRLAATQREILRFYDEMRGPLIALVGPEPQPYGAFRALLAEGAPLRIGDGFRLRTVERTSIPTARMNLPGPVLGAEAFERIFVEAFVHDEGGEDGAAGSVPDDGNEVADENAANPD